jgi:hypothetical protein
MVKEIRYDFLPNIEMGFLYIFIHEETIMISPRQHDQQLWITRGKLFDNLRYLVMAQTRHSNGIHWLPRWLVQTEERSMRRKEREREEGKTGSPL